MFRLRRYFSLASLFAFVIVTILLGMLYRTVAVRTFVQLEESKNRALTQLFAHALWPEFSPLLTAAHPAETAEPANLIALRQAVVAHMAGLSVIKIKFYDLEGNTLFSTELSQIGENRADNVGFQRALQGEVVSELTYRDKFSAFEGVIERQNVLSTYLAVRPADTESQIAGVFELYSNVTPLLHQINTTQWQLMTGVGLMLACLYGALFFIVSRAEGMMHSQQAAQQAAALELRQQQRRLAVLHERERLARELHDSLGQVLGYVNTQTQAARLLLAKGKTAATDELLLRLVTAAKNAHVELRDFILQLQNGESSEQNLVERLRLYLQQCQAAYNLRTELVADPHFATVSLSSTASDQLYRIVQEALNNVYKHAGAQQVTVTCTVVGDEAQITIQDDGRGFDPSQAIPAQQEGLGLPGMQVRARELHGAVDVLAQAGQGTTIVVRLPASVAKRKTAPQLGAPAIPKEYQLRLSPHA